MTWKGFSRQRNAHSVPKAGEIWRLHYILRDDDLLGALEYDLACYLHADARGLFASPPSLTWRQVIVWLRHLPSESALGRCGVLGARSWTLRDHMMASLVDGLRVLDWHYVCAHSPDEVPPPTMIRRPGNAGERR